MKLQQFVSSFSGITLRTLKLLCNFNYDGYTDFEDEFKPVKVRFAKNLSQSISIRLDAQTLKILRTKAKEKGIDPTTLARMWILEHLHVLKHQEKHHFQTP